MSTTSQQQPSTEENPQIQVQSVVKSVLDKVRQVRQIKIRPFFEDIVTFTSIIGAYFYVSLSYERERDIEHWTGIQFTNTRTQAILLLIFAIYLITLKVLHTFAYKYDTAPPKKILPDNWQEMEETQQQTIETVINPYDEKILPLDSYSALIQELVQYSIYGFVFMFCTTSYTFISVFNKKNNLVQIQQINYLILWYVTATILYSIGKIFGKLTGIKTFHHFGLTIGIIILLIEIGLAHGFNTFIFI